MSLKDPEARKQYNREYTRRRKEEDPEYREKRAKQQAEWFQKKYREDEKFRQKREADKQRWLNEMGGRDRNRQRNGYKPLDEYLAEMAAKRKNHSDYMRDFYRTPKGQRNKVASSIKKRGVSIDEYDAAYDRQEGKCRICGVWAERYAKGRHSVDHCHRTGAFRALLCGRCNAAIGLFAENEETMQNAIKYLQEVRAVAEARDGGP